MDTTIATDVITASIILRWTFTSIGVIIPLIIAFFYYQKKQYDKLKSENTQIKDENKNKEFNEMKVLVNEVHETITTVKNELVDFSLQIKTFVTKERLDREISDIKKDIDKKQAVFETKINGEIEKATNALNTANKEVRSVKEYMRGMVDAVTQAINGLPDGERTKLMLSKKIQKDVEDFLQKNEGGDLI